MLKLLLVWLLHSFHQRSLCSLADEWQAGAWSLALASAIEAEGDVAMDVVSAVADRSVGRAACKQERVLP